MVQSSSRHLVYAGNSYEPVDSGIGRRGEFLRIAHDNAEVYWYKYTGDGEQAPGGGPDWSRWQPGSGDQIGRSWDNCQWVFSLGDSTYVPVRTYGYAFRYDGGGRQDPDGTSPGAWSPGVFRDSSFGAITGAGEWDHYRYMLANPLEGSEPFHVTPQNIFGVDDDGSWHWHRYVGDIAPNPGQPRWAPNSGNQVRALSPTSQYRNIVAIGDIVLTVAQSGDVQWHRYGGNGESYASAYGGPWHPNSGHTIATGWQRYDQIFGGKDWTHTGYAIFAVDAASRDLHYFRYTGFGENDPGMTRFVRRELVIGVGW